MYNNRRRFSGCRAGYSTIDPAQIEKRITLAARDYSCALGCIHETCIQF